MNDFRLFHWHNVGEITLFLYGTNNNFSKSIFYKFCDSYGEEESSHGDRTAESLNAPVVQLCFAWKLLKNPTLFHCLLSYFISEGG